MSYSSIVKKKKICVSCETPQYIFSRGRCQNCAKREDFKPIKKSNLEHEKKAEKITHNAELGRWFEERRKEMTGLCKNCHWKSCKEDDDFYKFSIAHILPKAYFPSVATHPDNFIELCFWGKNSCHTNMDNKMLDMSEMSCWNEIVVKFQRIYPFIAEKEKRRIPSILLQYIGTDT